MPVLGQVDDTCRRINGRGLVLETAQVFQRHRLLCLHGIRGHFKNISMFRLPVNDIAAFERGARIEEAFFAGKPATPRRWPAGAIILSAHQAHVHVPAAAGDRIIVNGCCAAERRRFAHSHIVVRALVDVPNALGPSAKRTLGNFVRMRFMIADEDDLTVIAGKRRHAILKTRNEQAVIHLLAPFRNHGIAESFRQIDDPVGIWFERSKAQASVAGVPRQGAQRTGCSDR